jgi:Na+/H+-translocating membrane pyrophosphatase
VFVLLFFLPADTLGEQIGRSIFFVIGAVFSATIGYLGMRLATFANIRVAAASREDGGARRPCASRSARAAWSACSPWASACWVPRSS